jgi:hypothetical protein
VADGVIDGRRPHRSKFLLAYFVLAAVVGIGVAAFLVFMQTDTVRTSAPGAGSATPAAWNGFRPRGFEADQVHQIATYISSTYHLPGGRELVAVKASIPPSYQNALVITDYAVSVSRGGRSSYDVIPAANSVTYELCGLGKQCAIASGKPSVARSRLLRREALELALYTFNYVKDIDAVTVLFPPAKDAKTHKLSHIALLFRQQDVQPSLQNPLVDTLPGPTPSMRNLMKSKNLPVVDSITRPLQFDFSVTQDNTNNRGYLVLDSLK